MSLLFIPRKSYGPLDYFTSQSEVITNPVNTVGIMGAGLALAFKKRYPDLDERYLHLLNIKRLKIGNPVITHVDDFLVKEDGFLADKEEKRIQRHVLLFPTKEHWKDPSNLEWIDYGFVSLERNYSGRKYQGLSLPALGCGLGGLKWDSVKALIKHHSPQLEKIFGSVIVYEPS